VEMTNDHFSDISDWRVARMECPPDNSLVYLTACMPMAESSK